MTDPIPTLVERIPEGAATSEDLMDIFIEWTMDIGLELYPAQEDAILDIFSGNHVVLNTPTGSGKSMVAIAMHFYSFATYRRSYYTSPIKALVSEKFFDLCRSFGAENVGMLSGDASINKGARIICCTAEILSATALSEGAGASIHHVIMDEFHYYGDRDRGMAWQLPLLLMPSTTFLLMSATLGDTKKIEQQLEKRTKRTVAVVRTTKRPVPLEFVYSTDPLLHTIQDHADRGLAPLYVVNFTQRECAELAQSLTSVNFCTKEEKRAILDEMKGSRFDTPYGKVVRKYLAHGIAVHHGGLLPKYRLLVERLGQKGLLKIICGTDTLGVGINLPIRTVLFSKLCKFDGNKVRILSVRDFKQIAGRAGRKGYDDQGRVVAQAPAHIIENKRLNEKASGDAKKKKKLKLKKAPERGYVHWDENTFNMLTTSDSEELTSRFTVTHGMLLNLLQRDEQSSCGYRAMIDLIALSHANDRKKSALRRKARMIFQSLRNANILKIIHDYDNGTRRVGINGDLQKDFSIHHSLSLFLIHAVKQLNVEDENLHLKALSFAESILEDPGVVLRQQKDKLRSNAYASMKAEGIEYDQRQEKLEAITYPKPDAELIDRIFEEFSELHPWVANFEPKPKSVVRDMYEQYYSFNAYVSEYQLERSEGVLLRHISQTYKTVRQNIPETLKTDEVHEMIAYLREVIARADSSLIKAWENMRDGVEPGEAEEAAPERLDADPKRFRARIRAELRVLVSALAENNLETALTLFRQPDEDPWTEEGMQEALDDYYEDYDRIVFDHHSRASDLTKITRQAPGLYKVTQVLCDPEGDNMWYLSGTVDVQQPTPEDNNTRLFVLEEIGN